MKTLKTVERRVTEILREHPDARNEYPKGKAEDSGEMPGAWLFPRSTQGKAQNGACVF